MTRQYSVNRRLSLRSPTYEKVTRSRKPPFKNTPLGDVAIARGRIASRPRNAHGFDSGQVTVVLPTVLVKGDDC